jgi:hypothetical protein
MMAGIARRRRILHHVNKSREFVDSALLSLDGAYAFLAVGLALSRRWPFDLLIRLVSKFRLSDALLLLAPMVDIGFSGLTLLHGYAAPPALLLSSARQDRQRRKHG